MDPTRAAAGRLFIFDAARALAALAVLLAHTRGFVMSDAARQPPMTVLGQTVFGLTALGHQAVIVFLVVSGTMVTRAMLAMHRRGRWSGVEFWTARLVRLWLVLVPCLLLGGLQDRLGLAMTDPFADVYGSPGTSAVAVAGQLGLGALAGNVAFLQGFAVPVFGSNLPLWTLAVEAWCYVCGFGLFSLWRARHAPHRLALHGLWMGALAAGLFTPAFGLLLPIWLIGAGVALALPRNDGEAEAGPRERPGAWLPRAGVMTAFGLAVVAARLASARHPIASDYGLAGTTAATLWMLATWNPAATLVVRGLRATAGLSYTLYLSHFPLLALLAATVLDHGQLSFGPAGVVLIAAAAALAIGQAVLLWWAFERRTGAVRAAVTRWIGRRSVLRPVRPGGLAR